MKNSTPTQIADFIKSLNNTSFIGSSISRNYEGLSRKIFYHASTFANEAIKREFGTIHIDWNQTNETGRKVYFVEI